MSIVDLIADILTNANLRLQVQALEKQLATLEEENTRLRKQVEELGKKEAARAEQDQFVECRGALFKRKTTGGYHKAVYCPRCRGPMASLNDHFPFHCVPCKTSVGFKGYELDKVMRELP